MAAESLRGDGPGGPGGSGRRTPESLKVVVGKEQDQDFLELVQLLKVVVKEQDQEFLEQVLELLVVDLE